MRGPVDCVFDLDGTISDPLVGIYRCVNFAMLASGFAEKILRNFDVPECIEFVDEGDIGVTKTHQPQFPGPGGAIAECCR